MAVLQLITHQGHNLIPLHDWLQCKEELLTEVDIKIAS